MHRAIRTLSAHLFGQGITVLGVVAVPWVCLGHWSVEEFGIWIIASALSQFFFISDGGLSGALANHLCMAPNMSAAKARATALQAFQLIRRRILLSLMVAFVVSISWFAITDFNGSYTHTGLGVIVFFSSAVASALQPLVGLFCADMRYKGMNGKGILISNLGRFLELMTLVGAVYFGAGLLVAAIAVAAIKAVFVTALMSTQFSRSDTADLNDGNVVQSSLITKELHRAGVGIASNFFALNSLLHGLVLVASMGGPVAAAIFSSSRTVARIPGQPLGVFFLSIGPEITDIYSRRDLHAFRRIALMTLIGSLVFSASIGGLAIFNSAWLEHVWLHDKVRLPFDLLVTMVIGMFAHIAWQCGSQILTAINQTYHVGLNYLGIAGIGLIGAFFAQRGYGLLN